MTDIRRVLKAVFVADERNDDIDSATMSIRRNNFMFHELGVNTFLIMTPGQYYGGEREMQDDLNDNAVGGKYNVMRATPAELAEFDRSGGHLHN